MDGERNELDLIERLRVLTRWWLEVEAGLRPARALRRYVTVALWDRMVTRSLLP